MTDDIDIPATVTQPGDKRPSHTAGPQQQGTKPAIPRSDHQNKGPARAAATAQISAPAEKVNPAEGQDPQMPSTGEASKSGGTIEPAVSNEELVQGLAQELAKVPTLRGSRCSLPALNAIRVLQDSISAQSLPQGAGGRGGGGAMGAWEPSLYLWWKHGPTYVNLHACSQDVETALWDLVAPPASASNSTAPAAKQMSDPREEAGEAPSPREPQAQRQVDGDGNSDLLLRYLQTSRLLSPRPATPSGRIEV